MEPDHSHQVHLPPPPYSETDPGLLTPATSQADNASAITNTASSVDDTIYTPPYSPTESLHRQSLYDADQVSSSSATAYFESRPVLHGYRTPELETYTIAIASATEPKDLAYPTRFILKNCTEQDWVRTLFFALPKLFSFHMYIR